uniref:Retrotransposon protein, putative, unclassified n=1 Tax=Oryza sativa subsp. japonica TaxID=39947 RepID=Q6Z2Y7_ORYSJ|nr:hypothetical protein [Oryza sativa Japonica Group]
MTGRHRRRGEGGGTLRLDDGDGAPAVDSDGEGADEDGDATATTMATSPSDGDDWSDGGDDGGARSHGARALPTARDEGEGGSRKGRLDLEGDDGGAALGFGRRQRREEDED